jgi:hypothetical protein
MKLSSEGGLCLAPVLPSCSEISMSTKKHYRMVFAEVEKTLINTDPTTYAIMKIIAKGIPGESSASSISGQFSMITNPIKVVMEAIVIFPSTIKILPIPETKVNFSACFRNNKNPFIADTQKFSEVKAI